MAAAAETGGAPEKNNKNNKVWKPKLGFRGCAVFDLARGEVVVRLVGRARHDADVGDLRVGETGASSSL